MQIGRAQIFTDVPYVTDENIITILQKALPVHQADAADIDSLLNFEAGEQPISRIKTFRPDIDCNVADNVAAEVVDFKLGYIWGSPITFVQTKEEDNATLAKAVALLNQGYVASGSDSDAQKLARFIEICGVGYTYIDINMEWEEGASYFTRDVLDPRNAFIIYSSYYFDHRPMVGVTFRVDDKGNKYFTCFTKERRYEITSTSLLSGEPVKWRHGERSKEANPLGKIPIIEWIRSYDRMGCFEKQLSEMNNLNLMVSDFSNGVDQNIQAVWHTNDVDFPTEQVEVTTTDSNGNSVTETVDKVKKPGSGDWLSTYTSEDGKTPFIKPLTLDYDYEGMLSNITTRRALILQKCHVPSRNDNSGGSTGIAMGDATGWSDAEAVAAAQDRITNGCMMNELKVVLAAIRESTDITLDNPLLTLNFSDVEPNVRRPKMAELTTKVNAACALIGKGFSLEDTLTIIPLAPDPSQVILRSGESIKRYQDANVFNTSNGEAVTESRPFPDYSDQISNSPQIDGMQTGNTEEIEG